MKRGRQSEEVGHASQRLFTSLWHIQLLERTTMNREESRPNISHGYKSGISVRSTQYLAFGMLAWPSGPFLRETFHQRGGRAGDLHKP